jgi:K+-transporting ATPase A subunit
MCLHYEPCKFLDSPPRPLERRGYRLARVDLQHEMGWRTDAGSFLLFGLIIAAPLFIIPRVQSSLPFNVSGARFQKPHAAFKFHQYVSDMLAIVLAPAAPMRAFRRVSEAFAAVG